MKKFCTLIFFISCFTFSYSQDFLKNPFQPKIGVKAGASFTDFVGSSVSEGSKWRTTWNAGAVGEYPISDGFAIRLDLLYTGAGYIDTNDDDYKIGYIIFPLMGKAVFPVGVSGTGSFGAGLQGGVLINEFKESDMLKTFDVAIPFQLGYEHESGIFVDTTYRLGAVNINDIQNIQNTGLNVDIGYFLLR